jgi:PIN domain nuclease of toxin-antitoxin system
MGDGEGLIIIDTQAWYWWVIDDPKLSKRARTALEAADVVGVSMVSCVEFARVVARKRILLDRHPILWIRDALEHPRVRLFPITLDLAGDAAYLEWKHNDPADRMIVATAIANDARVVSKDDRIRLFQPARAIW